MMFVHLHLGRWAPAGNLVIAEHQETHRLCVTQWLTVESKDPIDEYKLCLRGQTYYFPESYNTPRPRKLPL
jgi:hypothetical protein